MLCQLFAQVRWQAVTVGQVGQAAEGAAVAPGTGPRADSGLGSGSAFCPGRVTSRCFQERVSLSIVINSEQGGKP